MTDILLNETPQAMACTLNSDTGVKFAIPIFAFNSLWENFQWMSDRTDREYSWIYTESLVHFQQSQQTDCLLQQGAEKLD